MSSLDSLLNLYAPCDVPIATAKVSTPVFSTNSLAVSGSVRIASFSSTLRSSIPASLPSSASTETLFGWAIATTFLVTAMFSSYFRKLPSIMTLEKPAWTHLAAVSKSSPWSRCMLIGTGESCAAVLASPTMYGKPAYFMTLGVIARMTGDFSSAAASATAVRLSRF